MFARALTAIALSFAAAACSPAPSAPVAADEAPLMLQDLDGQAQPVETFDLQRDGDAVHWAGRVGDADFTLDVDADELVVRDDAGRALLTARMDDAHIYLQGWTGGDPFEATLARPAEVPLQSPALAYVDDALAFPPTDDAAGFFAPMVDAGNVVAAPLALVALPILLEDAERDLGDGLAVREQPMVAIGGAIIGGAVLGGAFGAAYCLRSSTTATCDLGNGTGIAVTCNACQGTAYCNRTVTSGSISGGLILGAEDEGSEGGSVTCTCGCR